MISGCRQPHDDYGWIDTWSNEFFHDVRRRPSARCVAAIMSAPLVGTIVELGRLGYLAEVGGRGPLIATR
jgi:hypothetical protein